MTISIIGCGWLGLPLAQFFIKKGVVVKGSTTTFSKLAILENEGIQPFLIRLSPEMAGREVADFFKTDVIIINIPPKRHLPNIETLYPLQIQSLIQQIKCHHIAKVLFVSSTGVYPNLGRVVTEMDVVDPARTSGKAIVKAEQLLLDATDFQTTILRMAGLIGGTRKAGRFFTGRKNIPKGKAPVNLVHLEDCIGVINAVIEQEQWGEIYNVCADEHPTRADFYRSQAKLQGFETPTFLMDEVANFKVVSNEKVKRDLAYTFKKLWG